jgi:putative MFS transporter
VSAERLTRQHVLLFAALVTATLFEGFDTALAGLVLPYLGREFGAGPLEVFSAMGYLQLGTVAAVIGIPLADRFGRRPVLLGAVAGYALLTLATAFASSLTRFAALQFLARLLMVTELALAFVIASEELPAHFRGRANGLLGAFAAVGAALPALFLAPLEQAGPGWRGLFWLGAIPLLLLPLLWRVVREPAVYAARPPGTRAAPPWRQGAQLLRGPYRRRFLALTALWFTVNFWTACALFSFTYYAFNERGWTARDVQLLLPVSVPLGFAGYALGGWLMDASGRKLAAGLYLALGAGFAALCYQSAAWAWIAGAFIALQMLQGVWPILHTWTAELFPTEMRATANALSHNLLGRWGLVLGPPLTGWLAERLGSTGDAVTWLALASVLALPLPLWLLPETRGARLEQVGEAGAQPCASRQA